MQNNMKRKKNYYIPFFYNAGYCCLMTGLYGSTGNVFFGAAALVTFFGYSFAAVQIYRHRKHQLPPAKSDKFLTKNL